MHYKRLIKWENNARRVFLLLDWMASLVVFASIGGKVEYRGINDGERWSRGFQICRRVFQRLFLSSQALAPYNGFV
jgi:hypothetical protein